jgi:hypothetical protein
LPPPPPAPPVVCPIVYFDQTCTTPTQAPSGPVFCWNNSNPNVVTALNGTGALSFSVDCTTLGLGTVTAFSGGNCDGTATIVYAGTFSTTGCGPLFYSSVLLQLSVTVADLCQVTCPVPVPAPAPIPAPVPVPVPRPAPVPVPVPIPAPLPRPAPIPVPAPSVAPPPVPTPTTTTTIPTTSEDKVLVGVTGGIAAGVGFLLLLLFLCCCSRRPRDPVFTRTFGTGIGAEEEPDLISMDNLDTTGQMVAVAARQKSKKQ